MGNRTTESAPLLPPSPTPDTVEIDLEARPTDQIKCRICLETEGRDFIAPCKCKGTSKYVHRECLDHWRAVREGFAFAHCTTCKALYHVRVHAAADRKWRTTFRFFVTKDFVFIFLAVQLAIASLSYLVYLTDSHQQFWLRRAWAFDERWWLHLAWGLDKDIIFYYLCGALLLGLSGCFITCYYRRVHAGEAELPLLFIMALVVLGLFPVIGIFCSVLVATMVGQRIWQRHYHILAKRMLTKEYVVEDVDGEMTASNWSPPPLPPDHIQRLKSFGLL